MDTVRAASEKRVRLGPGTQVNLIVADGRFGVCDSPYGIFVMIKRLESLPVPKLMVT